MNIISSIIANIISPLLLKFIFGKKYTHRIKPNIQPNFEYIPEDKLRQRIINQFKFRKFCNEMLFYFTTYMMLYCCLVLSIMLTRGIFNTQSVFIDDAKIIGNFMPHILVGSQIFQSSFAVLAFIFYIPLFLLSVQFSKLFEVILDPFIEVNYMTQLRIQAALLLVFSLGVGVLFYWLYNQG